MQEFYFILGGVFLGAVLPLFVVHKLNQLHLDDKCLVREGRFVLVGTLFASGCFLYAGLFL